MFLWECEKIVPLAKHILYSKPIAITHNKLHKLSEWTLEVNFLYWNVSIGERIKKGKKDKELQRSKQAIYGIPFKTR